MNGSARSTTAALALLLTAGGFASAQSGATHVAEPMALFNVVFYGRGANSLDPSDPHTAQVATRVLASGLGAVGRFRLVDSSELVSALHAAEAEGIECNTLACRQAVAARVGARWMVTAKVSKTSNLIWYLSGQLTEVATGRRLLDDEFELKGNPQDIIPQGAQSLTRRIVRAMERAEQVVVTDTPPGGLTLAELKRRLETSTSSKPADLSGADLRGLDLTGLDFKQAILARADLRGGRLAGANLFACDLTDAKLTQADARKANFDGTTLRRADLRHANLEGASLFATIIEAANLDSANLAGTRIIGYLRKATLRGARLAAANIGADPGNQSMGVMRAQFGGADLSGADLSGANLFKADFSYATLHRATLTNADLRNSELIGADLTGADLTDARLDFADVSGAIFKDVTGRDRIQGLASTRNREKALW